MNSHLHLHLSCLEFMLLASEMSLCPPLCSGAEVNTSTSLLTVSALLNNLLIDAAAAEQSRVPEEAVDPRSANFSVFN